MPKQIAIVGAGPSGLMAAEVLVAHGFSVTVYDAMPSAGRKFLQAGRGGLNISHIHSLDSFIASYGNSAAWLAPMIRDFDAQAIQDWMRELGIDSFVGSSGRIFPADKKAAPLLRAWLHRLKQSGVVFCMKHRFIGWQDNALLFQLTENQTLIHADAVVLALGGASWPQLGSKGDWFELLINLGVNVAPLKPSNCSFCVNWTRHIVDHFAGSPIKPVVMEYRDVLGQCHQHQGELIMSSTGLEGGLIYRFSAQLREAIEHYGPQQITLDLIPSISEQQALAKLNQSSSRLSLSNQLKNALNLSPVKIALVQEYIKQGSQPKNKASLVKLLKHYPVTLTQTGSLVEAISTAGGVRRDAVNENLMLNALPSVFCVGEMLDWEAPTGGYLLTGSLATARWGAYGVTQWLSQA